MFPWQSHPKFLLDTLSEMVIHSLPQPHITVSLSACVCLRSGKGYRDSFVGFRWTLSGVRTHAEASEADQYVFHQSSAHL